MTLELNFLEIIHLKSVPFFCTIASVQFKLFFCICIDILLNQINGYSSKRINIKLEITEIIYLYYKQPSLDIIFLFGGCAS